MDAESAMMTKMTSQIYEEVNRDDWWCWRNESGSWFQSRGDSYLWLSMRRRLVVEKGWQGITSNIAWDMKTCITFSPPPRSDRLLVALALTFYGHTKTAEQQYGYWYTGRWWVGCYIWYSEATAGCGHAQSPPRCTKIYRNITTHPSTVSVPTSYHSMWHYNCLCALKLIA